MSFIILIFDISPQTIVVFTTAVKENDILLVKSFGSEVCPFSAAHKDMKR